MSNRYMNAQACGIEPEREGDAPTLEQWRDQCRALWAQREESINMDEKVFLAILAEEYEAEGLTLDAQSIRERSDHLNKAPKAALRAMRRVYARGVNTPPVL